MESLTYEAILRNPDLLDGLRRNARRERSDTVHRLTLDALRRLFSRPRRGATVRGLQPAACG
jgi:hypothetical protein